MSTISHDDVGEDLRRIMISGRLDTHGANEVAPRLEELTAAPKKGVVVDLSGVEFLASAGVRALITSAKAVKNRGGRLVLVSGETPTVLFSLRTAGIDHLIPVFKLRSDAEKAALT
jgi:anti-anti-sigma factor